ncbi:MAG: polysaccharide pyruvyl transferase family protein [Candidatus Thorarchaeota archaeon]|jgi:polysaccharide pyruvyl transferase WcaK-like protein
MTAEVGKRILIFGGWFGSRNAGDEAILLALKHLLEEAIPGARIFAHSIDPEYTRRVCGVEPVFAPRNARFPGKALALMRAYRSMDLFVVSGGTPIFDYFFASRAFHLGVPLMSRIPMVFFGIGVKPVRSRYGKWFYRHVLKRAKYISARDPNVRERLEAMGVDRKIDLTADSAICLPSSPDREAEESLCRAGLDLDQPIVGICPIFLSDNFRDHYHEPVPRGRREAAYQHLADLADRLITTGRQVVFLPMHQVPPDDDCAVIQEIRERMQRSAPALKPDEDPSLVTNLLGRMDMVVGMRLHSVLLASSRHVPVCAIGFDMKVGSFMDYLSMGRYCESIHTMTYEKLHEMTEDCWRNRNAIRARLRRTMDEWRGLVERSASKLAELPR